MFYNLHIGVDTIRIILTQHRLNTMMKRLNLEYETDIDRKMIERFKKEIDRGTRDDQTKEIDYKLDVISISKNSSLFGYILVKNNYVTIKESKRQKKSKRSYKRQVIFTALNQPLSNPATNHIDIMYRMIKEFLQVSQKNSIEVDVSVDGKNTKPIIFKNIEEFKKLQMNHICNDSKVIHYQNSFYINEPATPINDYFVLNRINVYDKYKKHIQHRKCPIKYKNWHRVESTYKIKQNRLSLSTINMIVENSIFISNDYFGTKSYDTSLLEKQIKLLDIN